MTIRLRGSGAPRDRFLVFFSAFLILNFAVAGVGLHYCSIYLYTHHWIPAYCDGTVIGPLRDMVSRPQGQDSWHSMLEAMNARASPRGIYQAVFFDAHTKFQYPLSALIPLQVLRGAGWSDLKILAALNGLSVLAFVAQIPLIFCILAKTFQKPRNPPLLFAVAFFLVLSFYPLSKAHAIGQIQIFLDLLLSAGFLAWMGEKERTSGFLIGLNVLVKPQYGIFLLWSLMRKRWSFFGAGVIPVAVGTLVSLGMYGWKSNLQYLDVLRYIGLHGEAFYPNQSVNGLANRFFDNGSSTAFDVHAFAPFHPVVCWLTLGTSLVLLAAALFSKRPSTPSGRIAEFGVVAISLTAASPVAWEHHYGVLLPLFAWGLAQCEADRLCNRPAIPLLVAFVLCADDLRITNLVAGSSPWNILQSLLLVGAMILFFYLRGLARRSIQPIEEDWQSAELDASEVTSEETWRQEA